jgi:hypothetical protein
MALETLQQLATLDGFSVVHLVAGSRQSTDERDFVVIDHESNEITFRIQNGPIGERGINGCQVDTMIAAATEIIRGLNSKFPCRENSLTITKLEEALLWSRARKDDRVSRGVEGLNKE